MTRSAGTVTRRDALPAHLLIRGARVVDPAEGIDRQLDVLVEDGRIAALGDDLEQGDAELLEAAGCTLLPGLIDVHVHLRTPGQEYKETSPPAPRPPRPAGSPRSWRCRTPTRWSTSRRSCGPCTSRPRKRRWSRSGSWRRSPAARRASSWRSSPPWPTPARSGSPTTAGRCSRPGSCAGPCSTPGSPAGRCRCTARTCR